MLMFLKYASGQQFGVILRASQEFGLRVLFLPEQLALWNITQVIVTTAQLFNINLIAAVNIRVSQQTGKKTQFSEQQRSRATAFCLEFAQQVFVAGLIALLGPYFWETPAGFSYIIFFTATFISLQNGILNLLVGFHESSGKFSRLGLVLPLNAAAQFLIILSCSWSFGLIGLFIGSLIGVFISVVILWYSLFLMGMVDFTNFERDEAYVLVRPAFTFKLADISTSVFYSLDVILASFLLPAAELAFFMTAKFLANFMSQTVFALNIMNQIHLGFDIGGEIKHSEISGKTSLQFLVVFLILIPLIVMISLPILDWAIPIWLPNYVESLEVLPFFVIGILFSARALFLRNIWIQYKSWKNIFRSGVMGLVSGGTIIFIGIDYINSQDPSQLACLIVFSQMPYAVFLILTASQYICGTKHAIFRVVLLFICLFQVLVLIYGKDLIVLFPAISDVVDRYQILLSFTTYLLFILLSYQVLRIIAPVVDRRAILALLKR